MFEVTPSLLLPVLLERSGQLDVDSIDCRALTTVPSISSSKYNVAVRNLRSVMFYFTKKKYRKTGV